MASVPNLSIHQFLEPLLVDGDRISLLCREFAKTYRYLARNSEDQFLATPITESLLPSGTEEEDILLLILEAQIDLRVGFIELLGNSEAVEDATSTPPKTSNPPPNEKLTSPPSPRVERLLERCWPIGDQLKNEKAEDLFSWAGRCIAEVLEDVYSSQPDAHLTILPLGVTFSFPMIQNTLGDATLMPMGKGFAITSNLDLRKQLLAGYATVPNYSHLPRLRVVAISNDAAATLVAFIYQHQSTHSHRRPIMAVIVGTGNNATIAIPPNQLHPNKRPMRISKSFETERIVINTEWSIKGTALPLQELDIISCWDRDLDATGETPGFMPFEYMTSGRYIGELCRIIVLDYFLVQLCIPEDSLPRSLRTRNGLCATFVGNLKHDLHGKPIVEVLKTEIPTSSKEWDWSEKTAEVVYEVARAVEKRAAGMVAAAIVGLLACAGDIKLIPISNPSKPSQSISTQRAEELLIGFTGGCITHFQDYLKDCQEFIGLITARICEGDIKVVLEPCHDGGIIGAGILAGRVMAMRRKCKRLLKNGDSGDFLSDEEESLSSSSPDDADDDDDEDADDDNDGDIPITVAVKEEAEDMDEGFAEIWM